MYGRRAWHLAIGPFFDAALFLLLLRGGWHYGIAHILSFAAGAVLSALIVPILSPADRGDRAARKPWHFAAGALAGHTAARRRAGTLDRRMGRVSAMGHRRNGAGLEHGNPLRQGAFEYDFCQRWRPMDGCGAHARSLCLDSPARLHGTPAVAARGSLLLELFAAPGHWLPGSSAHGGLADPLRHWAVWQCGVRSAERRAVMRWTGVFIYLPPDARVIWRSKCVDCSSNHAVDAGCIPERVPDDAGCAPDGLLGGHAVFPAACLAAWRRESLVGGGHSAWCGPRLKVHHSSVAPLRVPVPGDRWPVATLAKESGDLWSCGTSAPRLLSRDPLECPT